MATFVLVHGGHHGGWSYREVARALRVAGHDVYTPTLTGLAEREHLMSENVTSEMHGQEIARLLFYEDLRDVILVGHSYGGIPITIAAEHTNRIAQLVYLDANVPRDGQSFFDLVPPSTRQYIESTSNGLTFPVMPAFFDIVPKWVAERLVAQPAVDLDRPISLPTGAAEKLSRTYLHAGEGANVSGPFGDWLAPWFDEVQREPWRFVVYEGDHEAIVSKPDVVARHLLNLVG